MEFQTIFEAYYKEIEKKIQTSSIKSYVNRMKIVYHGLDLEYDDQSIFTTRYDDLIDYIVSKYSNTSTRKTTFACLVIFAKALKQNPMVISKLQKIMTEDIEKYNEEKKNQINTRGNELPKVDFDEIKNNLLNEIKDIDANRKRFSKENLITLKNYLIYSLYVVQAPVRADYGSMRMLYDDTVENIDFNYCDMKNKNFIFNNYKTKAKYGRVVVAISPAMFDVIERYQPIVGNDVYLIVMRNGMPYGDTYFSMLIRNVFGCGCSALRKIYLTNKYQSIFNLLGELDEDAKAMMHSQSVQRSHYLHKLLEE